MAHYLLLRLGNLSFEDDGDRIIMSDDGDVCLHAPAHTRNPLVN